MKNLLGDKIIRTINILNILSLSGYDRKDCKVRSFEISGFCEFLAYFNKLNFTTTFIFILKFSSEISDTRLI